MNKIQISYLRRQYREHFGAKSRLKDKEIAYISNLFRGTGRSFVLNVIHHMLLCDTVKFFKFEGALNRDLGIKEQWM